MALLPLLLCSSWTVAAPVAGGVQLAVFPGGADFVTAWFDDSQYDLAYDQVGGEYSCWDELGILDFNLNIPVESVQLELLDYSLQLEVEFGTIQGQDMVVYALDEDYFDTCVEFESELLYLTLEDPRFEAQLHPDIQDGQLVLEVMGDPTVSGDLDMDIDWWPDDLVLAFYEETIFEELSAAARELLPELVAEGFDAEMLSGQVEDFAIAADLRDVEVSPQALQVGADLSSSWLGQASCQTSDAGEGAGAEPQFAFDDSGGSHLGLGLSEFQLNASVRQLMSDGYFCFGEDRMDLVYQAVEELFDPSIGDLRASAVLGAAPTLTVEAAGANALFSDVQLEVWGTLGGLDVQLLSVQAEVRAVAELGLESSLTAITMSLHELELQLHSLEAEHLLSDSAEAEAHLCAFLEGWVAEWVQEEVQGVALFAAQYYVYGTYLRVDQLDTVDGGMVVYASLFDEDDPAVDQVAPDTQAWLVESLPDQAAARLAWVGSDDRAGDLAYAWQLDGTGWSSWSGETEILLEELEEGVRHFDVQARDSWLNPDPSPAHVDFDLSAEAAGESAAEEGCGCGAARGSALACWFLALAGMVARRRRD